MQASPLHFVSVAYVVLWLAGEFMNPCTIKAEDKHQADEIQLDDEQQP
jgi:hypothetical protein